VWKADEEKSDSLGEFAPTTLVQMFESTTMGVIRENDNRPQMIDLI